jgi:hypothetical protein
MRAICLLLLLAALAALSGCVGPESDNTSVRPWNTSKSWETGLPPMEGR